MNPFHHRRQIDIVASSGSVRVTVTPKPHWAATLVQWAILVVFIALLYRDWSQLPFLVRAFALCALVFVVSALIYQSSGTEIIEFDARTVAVHKGIHGWERKREYLVADCTELEWSEGSEGELPSLKCRVGSRTVRFGEYLSESESVEILTTLQRTLPEVTQQVCSQPAMKQHFITLGIDR
jgi:Integral membrane protein (DUF2244)